jgi:hypothetical protein
MKAKPSDAPATDQKPVRDDDRDKQPLGPEQTMHTEFQTRKARGRLSREDQRRLGDVLQRVYDDILKQGVPDRFKDLIDQLGQNDRIPEPEENIGSRAVARAADTGHGVQVRGGDKSRNQS